ncbi:cupin domain-containing protein [Xenophilus sp.]|uniref:cupin domain-containing protein n=1 Tax=Xenophilus sp. TaxID=1873499 RepID=UPI0037DC8BFA
MALQHARFLEAIDLAAPEPIGSSSTSSSLLKTGQMQVMRLVLPAGHALPEHHVPGEITIQCLSGEADVTTPHASCRLAPGQLVALPAAEPHAVHANEASTLLVTVVRIQANGLPSTSQGDLP